MASMARWLPMTWSRRTFRRVLSGIFSPLLTWACSSRMLLTSRAQAASIRSRPARCVRRRTGPARPSPRGRPRASASAASHVLVVGAHRQADDRGGDRAGEDRVEGQLVEFCAVVLLARPEAATGVTHRERERLGDEHVVDHDVVGPGAPQTDHVPDVDDLVVRPGDHERAEVDDLDLGVEHEPAQQHPLAVVAARGEAPRAREPEAAVGDDRLARRGVRRAQPGVGVAPPHRLLRLVGEQRHLPGCTPTTPETQPVEPHAGAMSRTAV